MPPLRPYKVAVTIAFLAAAACFLLPFFVISVDQRSGSGSGFDIARGEPTISGRYVHASYVGEVERGFDVAELPAGLSFLALLVGAVGAWLPGRKGFWLGLAAAAGSGLGLFWARQAVSGPTVLADVFVRYGYWIALVAVVLAGAVVAFFLRRTSWTYLNR
jgi:hypothetical protein